MAEEGSDGRGSAAGGREASTTPGGDDAIAPTLDGDASRDAVANAETLTSGGDSMSGVLRAMVATPGGDQAAPISPGTVIDGQYRIDRQLGRGGMGVVYLAHDLRLDRDVALKISRAVSLDALRRLEREAVALARLSHPNVVVVHQVGETRGQVYIAMEHVAGGNAREWLAADRRTWGEIVELYAAAGDGLAAAHAAGFVHRDFKPDNVLVGDDGRPRVADFGLAQAAAAAIEDAPTPEAGEVERSGIGPGASAADVLARVTQTGAVLGTPMYMAPEQLAGTAVDARADQYAFCVSLVEALRGRNPLADSGPTALFDTASRSALQASPAVAAISPPWLRRIVVRGLNLDPADRFPDMAALIRALRRGGARRAPWIAAAAAGAVAIAAAVWVTSGGHGVDCSGVDHELDGVWDAAARARGAAAVAKLGLPYGATAWARVASDLDGYARRWTVARRAVCQAGGGHHDAGDAMGTMIARQTVCLDDRRAALAALARGLGSPDRALLEHAGSVAAKLPSVADCSDLGVLAAVSTRSAGTQARADLATARAARVAGRNDDALVAARRALAAATHDGDRALEAEAKYEIACALDKLDRLGDAIHAYEAAADAAGAIGATPIQIDAWTGLGDTLQTTGRLDAAAQTFALAEAALAKDPDHERRGSLLIVQGTLAGRRGDFEGARKRFEQALQEFTAIHAEDSESAAAIHADLAIVYRHLGRLDDALTHARRTLELRRSLGDEHPGVARAHAALSPIWIALGHPEKARAELEQARAILAHAPGPHDAQVAHIESELGRLAVGAGAIDEAAEHFRTEIALWERARPGSASLRNARQNLAAVLTRQGHHDEAERMLRALLADDVAKAGASSPQAAHGHSALAEALAAGGRLDDALAELERARTIFAASTGMAADEIATLSEEADLLRTGGRWPRALERDRAALALGEARLPPGARDRATLGVRVAQDEVHLGRAAQALPRAEAAGTQLRSAGDDAGAAAADFVVAQARWALGRDRPGAVALARQARATIAKLEPVRHDSDLTDLGHHIDTWLAAHDH